MTNKLDSLNIEKSLELFPEQILNAFSQIDDWNLDVGDFENIVVSGMGGSSNAGKIIQSWQESANKIPLTVYNGYALPAFVNNKTLVVLNSYSGNTEETLSAYNAASSIKSQVIGVATGGKIGEMIKQGEITGAIIDAKKTNPSTYPKSGLGVSLGGLLGVLNKVGYLTITEAEINSVLDELVEIRKSWQANKMSSWLDGFIPALFSDRQLIGPLNAGRNAMCEISRNFTQFYDFPEVNHVLIEALQKPEGAKNNKYIFFESKFDNPRVKTRFEITKKILDKMGIMHTTYYLLHTTFFGQCLELPHFCAWVGYYLSILQNTDPGPEPWIIELKDALSQPIH